VKENVMILPRRRRRRRRRWEYSIAVSVVHSGPNEREVNVFKIPVAATAAAARDGK
jgi:hypothetical protein